MMKRIVLMVTVAMVAALMLAVAGPAFATIHPLSNAECADASASDVATEQEPPGISGEVSQGEPPNNFIGGNFAQPVLAASGGDPFSPTRPSPAFKTFGTSPAALDVFFCPANR
jgi:hypothetical protein